VKDFFLIAKIVSIYEKPSLGQGKSAPGSAVEGFVKIFSYSDFPERFFDLKKVYLEFYDEKKEFCIEKVEKIKDYFLLKFKNFDTNNDASMLVGKEIFVDNDNLVNLPENYFFVHDLIGSSVFRNNEYFGKIKDVLSYPANDVYVIEYDGNEILIPAVPDYLESFDPEKKILVLKPGGELYDNDED
jgi:16S rRNA processing protein RimM